MLLRNNRVNTIRVVIEDVAGEVREVIKKIAGSYYIYQDSTGQGIFVIGLTRDSSDSEWDDILAGLQLKNAINENNSINWELAVSREIFQEEEPVNLANLFRFAHRTPNYPLVVNLDWLAGGEIGFVDHGARSSLMYTMERGHISTSLSYIPPAVTNHVEAAAGGRVALNLQRELADFWLIDFQADTVRSIQQMSDLELYRGNISLNYRDNLRNTLGFSAELATRNHEVFWEQQNILESSRDWTAFRVSGGTQLNNIRLSGKLDYRLDQINFRELPDSANLQKAEIELDINSRLTENLIAAGSLSSSTSWFEGRMQEQDLVFDGRARFRLGDFTLTLSGFTERNRDYLTADSSFEENRREITLAGRYFAPGKLTLTGELRNTYLYFFDESYFSGETGISYKNSEKDWQIDLNLGYVGPVGYRDSSQEKIDINLSKGFDSGHTISLNASRDYSSIYQEDPSYRISLSLSQVLGFAQDQGTILGQKNIGNEHRSYIAGVVYLDQAGTGVRDRDDPLLGDISILREGIRTRTDDKGRFMFENVRPGIFEVGIDLRNLSAEYNVITDSKVVKIRENENIYLEFGVTMSGTISGRVFLDSGMTGAFSSADEPVSMIGLEIKELNRRIYTRNDGTFYFDSIPLGSYKIRILPETIPAGMRLMQDEYIQVDIIEDSLNVRNLNISLVYGLR